MAMFCPRHQDVCVMRLFLSEKFAYLCHSMGRNEMKPLNRLEKLLNEFVESENYRVRARLERLFDFTDGRPRKNAGFEKWLQYELVLFFLRKKLSPEIEQRMDVDKRKSHDGDYLQMDIVLQRHDMGIELKVRGQKNKAIKAMKSDLAKFSKALASHINKKKHNFSVVLCGEELGRDDLKKLNQDIPDFKYIPVGDRVSFIVGQTKG